MKQIIAKPNHSKRTFTLIKCGVAKYRTFKMSKIEFETHLLYTETDWVSFLKYGEYYLVK